MLATDSTLKHFLKDLVKPRRKFNIAAITAYIGITKTKQHEQNPADPVMRCQTLQRVQEPMPPLAVQGADRRWVRPISVIRFKYFRAETLEVS